VKAERDYLVSGKEETLREVMTKGLGLPLHAAAQPGQRHG
jgi:hypothetical protein